MKKLTSFIILFFACLTAQSQTIEYEANLNDSTRAYSTSSEICRSFTDKMVLAVSMTKIAMTSGRYYYYLRLQVSSSEACSIPKGGRVLIRTADDSVVELKSSSEAESELHTDFVNGIKIKTSQISANYIVSEADLQKMFKGVKKLRMEISPTNYDKTFKKDKIGQVLFAEYNLLKDKKYNDAKSNFSEGF